jgi:hypothetical protein
MGGLQKYVNTCQSTYKNHGLARQLADGRQSLQRIHSISLGRQRT